MIAKKKRINKLIFMFQYLKFNLLVSLFGFGGQFIVVPNENSLAQVGFCASAGALAENPTCDKADHIFIFSLFHLSI